MLFWVLTIIQILLIISAGFLLLRGIYILRTFQTQIVPYVPITWPVLKKMILLAHLPNDAKAIKIADLGAGTGKMMMLLAKNTPKNVLIYGVEKSRLLYLISRWRRLFNRRKSRINLFCGDWSFYDIKNFEFLFLFLTTKGMASLYSKFARELKPGAKIISYLFSLPPNQVFIEEKKQWGKHERIFIYTKKSAFADQK
ncbi:MAG: hypothetical protein A2445_00770 [Candidatus Jacksonbacteria bacterium RIFOXYC2_FULL_44_29]|nr:MAG: hypothetical protein UV19_C0004G0023 [Parcubacteria group bacterium GW2011_GWA2_42_28]KKT55458.1 MAG: hypothetical protein UW45_C0007G0023 [Parcubacteria group bacterium GW2011_GWC2_44_22]OGY75233.1 MAG: hypothetical protein A2240_05865 [Candidatus Jacksonbacteria bacterium RIFOXYA2_FULL_43_12]OGY75936.1 MAG: hypothetical protein A2295_03370 [Candidatus Jacksonbacteria bacterium RIFOXYB2_FULL_44_15]OGY77951.1 MAG: hypothetical protein A2445_00770 [Candidatus Jacksonbacteria bacterium RI